MNKDIGELDTPIYMQGHLLADSLLIKSYNIEFDADAYGLNPQKAGSFLEGLAMATSGLQALGQLKDHRLKILDELKSNILNLIRKGDLIAFGFKEPRNIADKPIKIPVDLFFAGELN